MPDGQTPVDRYTGFPGRVTSKKRRRRFQVPSSLPFVRSSNRRQKRMRLCEPTRKRCPTRPVSSGSPSPRPRKALQSTASSEQKNYRLRIRGAGVMAQISAVLKGEF